MPLKKIGMLGGMSWTSSVEYYRIINRTVQEKKGGSSSAKIPGWKLLAATRKAAA